MMVKARNQVKNMKNVGRTGKAGKEAQLVSDYKIPLFVGQVRCLLYTI
jgi:hypothetical protein